MISAISFAGGLVLFLISTLTLSRALGAVLKGKVRSRLHRASVPVGFVVGTAATAAVQSSTLVSVVLLGLVEAGAMGLGPAFAAILGANVGTTVTAGLASLRPTVLGWVSLVAGLLMVVKSSRSKLRAQAGAIPRDALIGLALFAFAGVVLGLDIVGDSADSVFGLDNVQRLLSLASASTAGAFIAGCVITAVLHSSSLVTVTLVNLVKQGSIPLEAGLALMLGSNVGTCITPLLASAPSGRRARILAVANLAFNLVGALLFLPVAGPFAEVLRAIVPDPGMQVAAGHAAFNMITATVALPFSRAVMRLFGDDGIEEEIDTHDGTGSDRPRHRARPHRVLAGVELRPSRPGRLGSGG